MAGTPIKKTLSALCEQFRKGTPKQLKQLAVDLLAEFIELPFFLARERFQHGGDGD